MTVLSIDVLKIPRDRIKEVVSQKTGKTSKYLDLVLFDKPDPERGQDGFVAIGVSKEERERGERGAIVGNWKHVGQARNRQSGEASKKVAPPAEAMEDDSECPF